ncbi:hypothetical protein HK099_005196 [Clydaea vesicula]|uniref:Guanine nucleotide-binding protein subunit beta-like protein n=1 Tax=Clydaea vesicula TaxID=447962 RepID=A0AAD5U1Y3_9FUNG|nr:hypothetical protein HK099_005196 [Clydaea vesicula]
MTKSRSSHSQIGIRSPSENFNFQINPNDNWRKGCLPLTFKRQQKSVMHYSNLEIPDNQKNTTCIAALNAVPFLVVGSAAKSNNLFIIENLKKEPNQSQLMLKSAFTAPHSIYHMSLSGDKLATAGPQGCVQLFQIDSNEINQKGKGLDHLLECPLGESHLEHLQISPPGTHIKQVRIQHIEFSPNNFNDSTSSDSFLALQSKRLFIWDLEASKVVVDEFISNDMLTSATWSTFDPLIAATSNDKNLYVLDARLLGKSQSNKTGLVWKVDEAHLGSVTCAKFNPFIPYWLATSGESGDVKIWDLRFLRHPAARIDGHYESVNSLCWSNVRCDHISTASSDRSFKTFNLNPDLNSRKIFKNYSNFFFNLPDTGFRMEEYTSKEDLIVGSELVCESDFKSFNAPLLNICTSPTHSDSYYTISSIGELGCFTIKSDLLEKFAPHRYDSLHQHLEHEIETSVYLRDMTAAYSNVTSLSKLSRKKGRVISEFEIELIELCTAKPLIQPDSWTIAPFDSDSIRSGGFEMTERFRDDLRKFGYFLPPGFANLANFIKVKEEKEEAEFKLVVFRLNLLVDISKENFESLINAEGDIIAGMERDPTFLDAETLQLLLETIIINDYLKGLKMGIRLLEIIEDQPNKNFQDFFSTVYMLVYPTVFDQISVQPEIHMESSTDLKFKDTLLPLQQRSAHVKLQKLKHFIDGRRRRNLKLDESLNFISTKSNTLKNSEDVVPKNKINVNENNNLSFEFNKYKLENEQKVIIEKYLNDSKLALNMVRLELAMQKLLIKISPTVDEDIVKLMASIIGPKNNAKNSATLDLSPSNLKPFLNEITISSHVNRIFLDALLNLGRFDEYFSNALEFTIIFQNVDFMLLTFKHAEMIAVPKLKLFVDDVFKKASSRLVTAIHAGQKTALPPKDLPAMDAANPVLTDSLIFSIKCFKDGFVMLVKIGVGMASCVETRDSTKEKVVLNFVQKIISILNEHVNQLMSSLSKLLEMIEGLLGKIPTAIPRNSMLFVKDGISEAFKGWPKSFLKSNSKDPSYLERLKTVQPLQEAILIVMEKIAGFASKVADVQT